ncbi:MAG TPA: 5'-nucleotidase C-terminal domain-containing protein [Saprospiraceae bacterium]|nr:5'-nucleotidase C-terminal domain-containing protein [Saprospiraceae bacterium]
MINQKFLLLLLSFILLFSCGRKLQIQSVEAENIEVNSDVPKVQDEETRQLNEKIKPYRDSLDNSMNEVLAVASVSMELRRPESLLGNFVADLMVEEFEEATGREVDLAVTNYFGLRIAVLDSGVITRRDVYELMPFDNTLVLATVDSAELKELFKHSLSSGGWPVSKDVQIIQEGTDVTVLIGGRSIRSGESYHILVNDYMASGGSDCTFMLDWDKKEYPFLLRDLIIEHLQEEQAAGNTIHPELSSRIVRFE